MFAQVGIGTTSPAASSILDLTSTTQGMLTPRMTTAQRIAIASPADGLMVYDTNLKSFFHYDSGISNWDKINTDANYGRIKFKRIKSTDVLATVLAAEKIAGSNVSYKLDANTLYEINGTIGVDLPIELNSAYISGLDANEDKLVRSGDLFTGATGGSIKNVTINVTGGGKVFNLLGTGAESLIFRDSIVYGCSSVGTIQSFGLVFFSIIQYIGNASGIVYDSIGKLLLNTIAWVGGNSGTYEKLQGTFGLVQKQSGFSEVNGTSIGFDVSANPIVTGDAVLETVVFTGNTSAGYVKPYSIANTYTGFNFSNKWNVRCAGIPTESDAVASGNLYDPNNTTATITNAAVISTGYKVLTNTTTATNLLRFSSASSGRLTYTGFKTRTFQVTTTLSFNDQSGGNYTTYVFYIAKIAANGTTVTALPETETYIDTNGGYTQSFPITGTVSLAKDESVEIWLKRLNPGTSRSISTYSFNITAR